jgi:hypothetical protein
VPFLNGAPGRIVDVIIIMNETKNQGVLAEFLKRTFMLEGLYKFLSLCETLSKVK